MPRTIFLNLPVADLDRSLAFYEAIGAERNSQFSDETAAMVALSESVHVMLLTHDKFRQFTPKRIVDAHESAQFLLALSCDSRADVDSLSDKAIAAGGREVHGPEDHGWMYSRAFEDPDGHGWGPFWMDAAERPDGTADAWVADAPNLDYEGMIMPDRRNPHGSFIWYELLTADPESAAAFYGEVLGWTAAGAGQPGVDYRIFSANGSPVGGHMKLPDGAEESGMRAGWLGYVGVDDVDKAVEAIEAAGGKVHMPAMDMDGVGRIALVADPQGLPFYVMRGASDEASDAFDWKKAGHCSWNELSTPDQASALDFYTALFGWEKGEVMPMGEMGGYQFLHHGGGMIGAMMTNPPGQPAGWKFAFGVRDIDAAAARIRASGGTVHHGPVEVPGGDRVVMAADPEGCRFMAVGPRD